MTRSRTAATPCRAQAAADQAHCHCASAEPNRAAPAGPEAAHWLAFLGGAGIHPKLAVSNPGDSEEREADAIARSVMAMPVGASPVPLPSAAARSDPMASGPQDSRSGTSPSPDSFSHPAVNAARAAVANGGSPLDPSERSFFEPRLGRDLSAIRIHTGPAAERAAGAIDALAYTHGQDIAFARGQYRPGSQTGRHLLGHELAHAVRHGNSASRIHRQAKPAPAKPKPVPGGNILYIGMNAYKGEVDKLKARYSNKTATVTAVVRGEDTEHTPTRGGTLDLTTDAGVDSFAAALGLDAARAKSVADLVKGKPDTDRDDLAHVIDVYARTDADGADRMTRVVLSGHSYGISIYGSSGQNAPNSHIEFADLVNLAGLFPKAAGQTRHLMLSACIAGTEGNLITFFLPAFPNLKTFSGWTGMCPTDEGSAAAVDAWAAQTNSDPKALPDPSSKRSVWSSSAGYKGDDSIPGADKMTALRADEAQFNDYFSGAKADPSSHSGWLLSYYVKARQADRDVTITGADHDYAHVHAEQAFRLRFWKAQVAGFWKAHGSTVSAGYGKSAVPAFDKMSRQDALKAIADFPPAAAGSAAEVAAARDKLNALKTLDETVMKADWTD